MKILKEAIVTIDAEGQEAIDELEGKDQAEVRQQIKDIESALYWSKNKIKVTGDDEILETLDAALDANLSALYAVKNGSRATTFVNPVFVGPAGCGKTGRVKAWADSHPEVKLVMINGSALESSDIGGITAFNPEDMSKAIKIRTAMLDALTTGEGMSVLFLDEYNRIPAPVLNTMLTLIQDHQVNDYDKEGKGYAKYNDLLFVIAAINPPTEDYQTKDLDAAQLGNRFQVYEVSSDARYTISELIQNRLVTIMNTTGNSDRDKHEVEKAIRQILLLDHFYEKVDKGLVLFDTPEEQSRTAQLAARKADGYITHQFLSARSFDGAIMMYNGNINKFIRALKASSGPIAAKRIQDEFLYDYEDPDDAALNALLTNYNSDLYNKFIGVIQSNMATPEDAAEDIEDVMEDAEDLLAELENESQIDVTSNNIDDVLSGKGKKIRDLDNEFTN